MPGKVTYLYPREINGNTGSKYTIRELTGGCFNFGYAFESKIVVRNASTAELRNSLPGFILGLTSLKKDLK